MIYDNIKCRLLAYINNMSRIKYFEFFDFKF